MSSYRLKTRLAPYLPGHGPTLTVEFLARYDGNGWDVYCSRAVGGGRLSFVSHITRYHPSPSAQSAHAMACEAVGVVLAYIDHPAASHRGPTDLEQTHSAFWTRHGAAFASCGAGRAD